jgi:hypothetical protein
VAERLWCVYGERLTGTAVSKYIAEQEQHHTKRSFEDEFKEMLRANEIEFDEGYLWT